MDLLTKVVLGGLLGLMLGSCAKFGYLIEQGSGQLGLLIKARENEKVLLDESVSQKAKDKIKLIQTYKDFFYDYFQREAKPIYSKTVFLEDRAVTHLVISSPHNQIQAQKECFPFMGCFPYIGFFKKDSAEEYQKELKRKGYVTWSRPVYAYSTLGYFNDPILSSFFQYQDKNLAELIFHELFHTIFFAKNEVDFNENLANYFGEELKDQFYKVSTFDKQRDKMNKEALDRLKVLVVKEVALLQKEYQQEDPQDFKASQAVLDQFINKSFLPKVKKFCREHNLDKKCFPLKDKWNNARFAAFLTYEKQVNKIEQLHLKKNLDLYQFFLYIEKAYQRFKKDRVQGRFADYLFREL